MSTVISVENVSKFYRLGLIGGGTLRADLERWWARLRGKPDPLLKIGQQDHRNREGDFIWALRDVSFEVGEGEILGIIGRNGAGKSTLLKTLSQVTAPTSGQIKIKGRVASLLEVGTGFHPELTGRENIYLNGAILGMTKAEIDRKFDEIVDFSGIEKFIDTPVKRYSSGMYVRLAFAVAAHLEPEILLVDEVLAVGDAQFQKKCLGKMGDVAKEGRTVLLVSHNMVAVQNLCERTIWIDQGRIMEDGASGNVVSNYLNAYASVSTEQVWPDINTAPGNDQVRLHRACIRPDSSSLTDEMTVNTPLLMEFAYWNLVPDAYLNLSLLVYTQHGILAFNTAPVNEPKWHGRPFPAGLFRSTCHIPGGLLNDDLYSVTLLIVKDQAHVIYAQENVLVFELIDNTNRVWHGKWPGAVRPNLKWNTELVDANQLPTLSKRTSHDQEDISKEVQ